MHVAWLIIKIILLTLGILLGLALILLLLFLFVPFHYRVDAVFQGQPDVKLKVSWLSFFLDFRASYKNREFRYDLKSFWVRLASDEESRMKKQGKAPDRLGHKKKKQPKENVRPIMVTDMGMDIGDEEPEIPVIDTSGLEASDSVWIYIRRFFRWMELVFTLPARIVAFLYRFFRRLRDMKDYFWKAVGRLLRKLKLIDKKRRQIVKLYSIPTTKTAIKNCKGYLLDLLAHLKPKKMTGHLTIGLKDPAATGQLFGFLGLLLPIYYDKIDLTADFEKERLEGAIHMKGGVTIAYLLWMLLKIYRDKYTMKTYERVRKILGGNNDGKRI